MYLVRQGTHALFYSPFRVIDDPCFNFPRPTTSQVVYLESLGVFQSNVYTTYDICYYTLKKKKKNKENHLVHCPPDVELRPLDPHIIFDRVQFYDEQQYSSAELQVATRPTAED